MIDLEQRYGPWSGRIWGLILNFVSNGVALYGVAGVLDNGSRWPVLIAGVVMTAICVLVLANPSPDE